MYYFRKIFKCSTDISTLLGTEKVDFVNFVNNGLNTYPHNCLRHCVFKKTFLAPNYQSDFWLSIWKITKGSREYEKLRREPAIPSPQFANYMSEPIVTTNFLI